MRYIVRIVTKKDILYLYVINNTTPALASNWHDATFFRTKEEAQHGFSLIRQNFAGLGITSLEIKSVKVSMGDEVYAKEYF